MNQMETFVKRMQEDLSAILHPDLVPFLEQDGALGPQLRHPLVYQVPFFSNGSANAFYEQKIKELLSANRPSRHYLMDESEVQLLNSLPEFVKIYRGCQKGLNENGLSWTLNKEKAKFFANRFSKEGIILEREIPKLDIIAVLTGRGESEVIWEETK